jgi:hypothetical protein
MSNGYVTFLLGSSIDSVKEPNDGRICLCVLVSDKFVYDSSCLDRILKESIQAASSSSDNTSGFGSFQHW